MTTPTTPQAAQGLSDEQLVAERAAFVAVQREQLQSHWPYDNPHGHEMVSHMLSIIPGDQHRAGEYVQQWVETKWQGWCERAAANPVPAPACVQGDAARLAGQLHVAVSLLREVVHPLEVTAAVIEDEDGGAATEALLTNVKRCVEQFDLAAIAAQGAKHD